MGQHRFHTTDPAAGTFPLFIAYSKLSDNLFIPLIFPVFSESYLQSYFGAYDRTKAKKSLPKWHKQREVFMLQ